MSPKKTYNLKILQRSKGAIFYTLDVGLPILGAIRTEFIDQFELRICKSPNKFFFEIKFTKPVLVLLDCSEKWMGMLKKLRANSDYKRIAVILVDSNPNRSNCILAFNSGCDDYFDETYPVEECLARIKAVLRRMEQPEVSKSDKIIFGDIVFEVENRNVFVKGNLIHLTSKEFKILEVLIKSAGMYVQRLDLLNAVWGEAGYLILLESQISLLRKKISCSSCEIKSKYKIGVGIFETPV